MSRYSAIAFTPAIKALQEAHGSRKSYARSDEDDGPMPLGDDERDFIESRDSMYMATVTETGWPYVQHRGGPVGFMRVLDEHTIAFADFRGNKQYISTGNISRDDRVSLFLMDYPTKTRLKLFARARLVDANEDAALARRLISPYYRAVVERLVVMRVEGYSWNCEQHITPRYTLDELASTPPSAPRSDTQVQV